MAKYDPNSIHINISLISISLNLVRDMSISHFSLIKKKRNTVIFQHQGQKSNV